MKKTQAFLVMGFIVVLALAIGFYMQKEDERNMRIKPMITCELKIRFIFYSILRNPDRKL